MYYVLIQGPSYRNLDFEAREQIREDIIRKLENHCIRFMEYPWIWDEQDRCLLQVGQYRRLEDAYWWITALESMGFNLCIRTHLPGYET